MGDYLPVPVIISENSFIAMSVLAGQVEKLTYLGIITFQNLCLAPQPNRLMKQKHNGIDTNWKTALLQAGHRFFDGAIADNVMDIGFHVSLEQQVNGSQCVGASVPTHRHGPAVFFTKLGEFRI